MAVIGAGLLIVDVSRYLTDPDYATGFPAATAMLPRLAELLAGFRAAGRPIFYVRGGKRYFTSRAVDLPDWQRGGWARLGGELHDAWTPEQARTAMDFDPQIAPRPGESVIPKPMPSAFFGTPLAIYLNAAGVDRLAVAGLVTSGCVRASVTDAFSHNYQVWLVADATADPSPPAHEFHLEEIGRKYARIANVKEILRGL